MDSPQIGFIGLDIETTGLEPDIDHILELGLVTFDEYLRPLEAMSWVIFPDPTSAPMDDVVRDMHTTSGLRDDMQSGRALTLPEAARQACAWIDARTTEKLPMVGSSVTFDRSFLATRLSTWKLLQRFHHRSVDATSVRLARLATTPTTARTLVEEQINTEAGVLRDTMLNALDLDPQLRRPHRPIYDICQSAATTRAAILHTHTTAGEWHP